MSTYVAAPPEKVWVVVGDPTRVGEISPECRRIPRDATGHDRAGMRRTLDAVRRLAETR